MLYAKLELIVLAAAGSELHTLMRNTVPAEAMEQH